MGRVEAKIQSDIIAYLKGRRDTYVLNVGGGASTAKGTPDLICCYRGLFIAFEVKRPDGSYGMTKCQRIRRTQIEKAGGRVYEVRSVDEVSRLLASTQEG